MFILWEFWSFFKPVVVQYHFMLNLLTLVFFPHLLWMSRLEIRWLKVKSLKNYYICVCYFIVYDLKAFVYSPEYPFLLSFKSSILNLFNDEVSLLIFDIFYMYILKQVRFYRYYLKEGMKLTRILVHVLHVCKLNFVISSPELKAGQQIFT